jgi:serine/threonine protein kinase
MSKCPAPIVCQGALETHVKGDAMSDLVEQLVGKTIGDYYLSQLLGQGKLSAVYAARREGGTAQVMLTIFLLPPECQGIVRERFMARFIQQAHALCLLRHPYIVPTYAYGEQDGYPYLVTPMIEGETIASLLKKQHHCSPTLTLALLRQIADALDYAHAHNVIHGTLKASNILLVHEEGSNGIYTVMTAGFGLAQMLEIRGIGQVAHQHPGLFSIAGTLLTNPVYIAPEVVEGGAFDERADVYALGILTFEMLCGQPPFSSSNPFDVLQKHVNDRIPALQSIASDVPAALDIALQRALEHDPERRLQTAGKLVTAFERVLSVIEEAAKPVPSSSHNGPALPVKIHLALLNTLPPTENIALPGITATHITSVLPSFPLHAQVRLQSIPSTNSIALEPGDMQKQIPEMITPKDVHANVKASQPAKQQTSRHQPGRRRIIKAVNGAITATVLIGGGFSLWHLLQHRDATQTNAKESKSPSIQTPAVHSELISNRSPDKNVALNFTDPLTHKPGILIRLPDNSLVAYDRACTHEGVAINYDPKSHTLICPRHLAQFDPAKKGAVLKGPATRPVAQISIQVSSDGTVSTQE